MVRPLREVHVERGDDGVLVVHWEADPGTAVDVGTGISPVVSEHVRFGRATRSTSVRFTGLGRHRRFVSLTMPGGRPVVVAERRLAFAGITNFRDLGGYPTIDGGTTCWGRVFRADALHKLTVADLVAFHDLGVRTVFDLRGEVERSDFPGPIESVHVPITGRPAGATPSAPPPEMSVEDGERMLRDLYVGALEHSAIQIGSVLRGVASNDGLPAVFHCHGGKDRTGIVAAVLLLAIGVDRETVLDDYEATRRYRSLEDQHDSLVNLLAAGVSPEAAAGVLGTPRWAMAAAIDAIDDVYGGLETYLAGPAELTAGELASLRECLTVAPRHHAVDIVDGSRSTRPAAARNPGSTTGCR